MVIFYRCMVRLMSVKAVFVNRHLLILCYSVSRDRWRHISSCLVMTRNGAAGFSCTLIISFQLGPGWNIWAFTPSNNLPSAHNSPPSIPCVWNQSRPRGCRGSPDGHMVRGRIPRGIRWPQQLIPQLDSQILAACNYPSFPVYPI